MSNKEKVYAAVYRAYSLADCNNHDNTYKEYEFRRNTVRTDETLKDDEKREAIKLLTKAYDDEKIRNNKGIKRICKNCNRECLATLFCEHCVRNYLKKKFSNWTSGNDKIDNLIQECQMKTINPDSIVEWIPYNNFKNIKYLTRGGFSEIYVAGWINGSYDEWDSKEQQLKRFGEQKVILKRLENIRNENHSWFVEAKSHLTVSNKWSGIIQCYGLTQDPSNKIYMLVMEKLDTDLRTYLQQNHNKLTWKERIQFTMYIISALMRIHNEAPEVIYGKKQTFESDIYSVAMLMWEISSGQPPFINYEHNYYLAMKIVSGIRPKIVPGTPLEYKNLIEQCWDADSLKRPSIRTLMIELKKLERMILYESNNNSIQYERNNLEINNVSNLENHTGGTSKLHHFENLPEPRNATKEEQKEFYNASHDFYIPDNSMYISNLYQSRKNIYEEDDIYNNPNLHPEEQDELALPDEANCTN
ncbi:kinase-like domain-containing protein [Rhizophagus clarus]|uniref:Kinase-like domain-containing protein n=1 Tax=Rhizophagus clarus TaxID=94130 RepID=A0A8H3KWL1_9GLOM|nr:kinase-like domain-containing protein [Rhizophagus clarus]